MIEVANILIENQKLINGLFYPVDRWVWSFDAQGQTFSCFDNRKTPFATSEDALMDMDKTILELRNSATDK